ncbi:MAG: DUF3667 domain-containing protein [Paraprevotella sp.]|nr:DUF3667 domain-containing protein [Paraprevotella sp.]
METKTCLNCGTEYQGNYCHKCGQPITTRRLSTKDFIITFLSSIIRMNKGFMFTCAKLVFKPWVVIADYVKGKRIIYTNPIQLLFVLCFIAVMINGWQGVSDASLNYLRTPSPNAGFWEIIAVNLLNTYLKSPVMQYISVALPPALAIPVAFCRKGGLRYNLAEYLTACLYFASTSILLQFVTFPLNLITPNLSYYFSVVYISIIAITSIFKAFNIHGWLNRTFMLFVYIIVTAVFECIIFMPLYFLLDVGVPLKP